MRQQSSRRSARPRARRAAATAAGLWACVISLAGCAERRPAQPAQMDTALVADLERVAALSSSNARKKRPPRSAQAPRGTKAATAPPRQSAPSPRAAPATPVVESHPTYAAGTGEPSEQEMRAAMQDRVDAVNENMKNTTAACHRGQARDDPVLAMQCLAILGASGGDRRYDFTAEITTFRKLGCEKALGRPGYVCDYLAGMSQNNPAMTGVLGNMMRAGEVTQARFVRLENGWLLLPIR